MANKREVYQINLTRPHGVTVGEMKLFLEQAIKSEAARHEISNPHSDIGYFPIKITKIHNQGDQK